MARTQAIGVGEILMEYADRGVLRGLSEVERGRFGFTWFYGHPMEMAVDSSRRVLCFPKLLPGVPLRSELYGELKNFIRDRHDALLPEHRRIDLRLARVTCSNRRGSVSISIKIKDGGYEYGVRKLVNLVHELFVHLRDRHPDYLAENFDVPQE